MGDLISRKALLDEIDKRQKQDPYKKLRGPVESWVRRWGYDVLYLIVKYFPAVDAEEVVRCRNCMFRDPETGSCDHFTASPIPFPKNDTDYCSHGKRRCSDGT